MSALDFGAGTGSNAANPSRAYSFTSPALPDSDWAIGIWVRRSAAAGSSGQMLFQIGVPDTTNSIYLYLGEISLGRKYGSDGISSAGQSWINNAPTATVTADGVDYLMVLQRRSNTIEVYMVAEGAGSATPDQFTVGAVAGTITSQTAYIGSRDDTDPLENPAGEFFIFTDRSLTAANVVALAAGAKPTTIATPTVYLPLRNGAVATETNQGSGGSTHDATRVGGTGFTTTTDFWPIGQTSLPNADVTDGAWTPSTGTDNYAPIDEDPASDTDYVSTNSNSTMRVGMSSVNNPDTGTRTLSYRAKGPGNKKLIVRLIEGASTVVDTFTVDPLPFAVTQYDQTVTGSISNYADLDVELEIADASSPPTTAVTYGAAGTGSNGTTSCTPSYPSGISAATSKLYCVVTGRSNTASTAPTMPAGWTSVGGFEGGTGTWGVDAGTRRVQIFRKDTVDGTETGTVTVSLSGTTANTMYATIHRVEVPSGYTISESFASGADTTSGTGFSATASSSIAFAPNDLLLIAVASATDTATQSAQSITATSITFGTRTNRASVAVTDGNDHRHIVDTVPVSSGTATSAPVYAYTASAATSGPVGFMRLRAAPPTEFGRVTSLKFFVPLALSGIALSITEAGDTVSAAATAALAAALTRTEANDTLGSALTAALVSALGITEGSDTLAAAVAAALVAALSKTEANDTLASLANAIIGLALGTTDANDTGASAGTAALAASSGVTEAADTGASALTAALVAALTKTEGNDTLVATLNALLGASSSTTDQADLMTATIGALLSASLATTDAPDSPAATIAAALLAALGTTDANDSLASTVTAPAAAGTLSLSTTDANDTLTAAATAALVAALTKTDANDALTSALAAAIVASVVTTETADTPSSTAVANLVLNHTRADAPDVGAATLTLNRVANSVVTEQGDSINAAAVLALLAAALQTEAGDTIASVMVHDRVLSLSTTDAADAITSQLTAALAAALDAVEAPDAGTSTLQAALTAALAVLESGDVLFADVKAIATLVAAIAEGDDTLVASAAELLEANSAVTLGNDTLSSLVSALGRINVSAITRVAFAMRIVREATAEVAQRREVATQSSTIRETST